MDEPTSCLTLTETNRLFKLIAELKSSGVSVIYISHRLMEVNACADRVVGLRDGKNSGQLAKSEISHDNMVRLMVGRNIDLKRTETRLGDPKKRIEFRNLISPFFPSHSISLDVRQGEILGLAGSGWRRTFRTGDDRFWNRSTVRRRNCLDGKAVQVTSPRDAIAHGIYLVPKTVAGRA